MKDIFKGVIIKVVSIIVVAGLIGLGGIFLYNYFTNNILGLNQHANSNNIQIVKEKLKETAELNTNAIYPVCLNRKPFHLSLLAKYFKDPDCFYAGVDWHFIHIFVTNSFFRSKILS